ncbi:DUF6340 family protein [Bacteroides sp. OttesenSCG-928-M17]|nr:DUF6340 family protein [Bacteroides sp. OttesenSCG-928-M17]
MSIDYLVPSDISFPAQVRKVGVVNNMSPEAEIGSNYQILRKDTLPKSLTELSREVTFHHGDAGIATQSLAESLAEQNYFDMVVICDSALRAGDIHPRENILSRQEVIDLAEELGVDILIALENLVIKSARAIRVETGFGYVGTVDAQIYPTVTIYIPKRTAPMIRITPGDTIFWEEVSYSDMRLRRQMIGDKEMIEEASAYSGGIPIKYLLPHWKTGFRYFYTGGSPEMRDAYIHIREENWDEAYALWQSVYEKRKGEKKMHAALNIALYHEMTDDLEKAKEWAAIAVEMSKKHSKKENITIGEDVRSVNNQILYSQYAIELDNRLEALSKLNTQMERFKNDF